MKKQLNYFLIALCVIALMLIRWFQTQLFYDPLVDFFKRDYMLGRVPEVELGKLILQTGLRYILNTGLSLIILFLIFNDKTIIRFSVILYVVLFLILIPLMVFLLISASPESNYTFLFYVRRFLIQPLPLLFLIPAFYYQKLQNKR